MDSPILALLMSFISMVCVAMAYFTKYKSWYLVMQAACVFFLAISYFFTMQFFAMIGIIICLARSLTFYVYEKKDKVASVWWAVFFSALTLVAYLVVDLLILQNAQPLNILLLLASCMYAFIFRIRDLKTVRYLVLIPTILSIFFNTLTQAAFFATIAYVIELTANVISIYRYHICAKSPIFADGES